MAEKKKYREHVAVKSIVGIVSALLVFSAVAGFMAYRNFTKALLEQYADGAFLTARAAADLVNPNRIDAYAESDGKGSEYLGVYGNMDSLCNSSGATFIYVIVPDRSDYAHITFLFSTINHDTHYTVYDFGYVRETTNDDYRQKYRALYEKTSNQELVIRDKGFIETDPHITAMIPLKAWNGEVTAILCVQRQMDVLVQERNSYIARLGLILGGMILLVIAGQSVFLNHTLLKPLYTITKEAKRFSEENTVRTEKLQNAVKNRDEIGLLAESIDSMEEQIGKYVEDLTKITAEKERISTELSLAKKIQAALLPSIFPPFPDRKEFDLYASMEPARTVGGDFYDFFLIDDDHLCLVMADVSGKGIPAALFMMICKTMLQSCAMLGQSSAEILNKVNQGICSNNGEEMFVTVWVGILEISTGMLKAANAGHEYPAVKKPGGKFELLKDPHGFVVGGLADEIYEEYTLQLEPGSALFLYTDGIPEAMTKDRQMFGTERMLEALNAQPDACPETVLKNVRGAAAEFAGGAEQSDDITMLALNYFGPQNKQ